MSTTNTAWKRTFALLWGGQAISILTSSVLQMAIVWYLTERTGSAAVLTTSTLIAFLPHAILGMFFGVFIDRYNRKVLMIASDLVIALAALALALVSFRGELPIPLIFFVLFVRSIGSAFHSPAMDAVIPSIVPKDQIARCAGYAQGFKSISLILSPALAAALFSIWDISVIILLDVAGAVIAIVIVLLLRFPAGGVRSGESPAMLTDLKAGFSVLRSHKGLTALMLISALYTFLYFPIGTLYPLITMTYFGGGVPESGTVEILFSLGMLGGSLLLGLVGRRLNKALAIGASIGLYGLGVCITGLLPPTGLPVFMGLSIVMGVSVPFFTGVKTAILQLTIEDAFLGRILSLSSSIGMITMPAGLAFGGAVSELFGVNVCFFLCGVLCLILSVTALLLPSLRHCCPAEER